MFTPMYASFLVASGRIRRRRLRFSDLAGHIKIIAHRGASHLAPENTLASVELAWRLGADAVEVDVRLTRDGRIVAIHDPTTDRTAGIHLEVAATHSSHLRRLDVGRYKHPRFAGERIPYLEEVLQTVPPGRQLFVEIKCGPQILPAARGDHREQRQAVPDRPHRIRPRHDGSGQEDDAGCPSLLAL